ncbi:hypothetical protein BKA81DRAFT_346702 [Phyllosticta paracitricarpa]
MQDPLRCFCLLPLSFSSLSRYAHSFVACSPKASISPRAEIPSPSPLFPIIVQDTHSPCCPTNKVYLPSFLPFILPFFSNMPISPPSLHDHPSSSLPWSVRHKTCS